jgi:DNA-binding CsgD family transcriptional regulator
VDRTQPSIQALSAVLSGLYDLYRHRDAGTFPVRVVAVVARALACDSAAYIRTDPARASFQVTGWPEGTFASLDHREAAELHAREHPLVAHYRDSRDARPWSLYDFTTRDDFHRSALYRKLYRPLGIEYQLAMLLPNPAAGLHAVAVNRSNEDFSDAERQTLELLWPHLTQAARNVRVLSRLRDLAMVSTQAEGRGIIVLDRQGHVELCTEQARVWLNKYCAEGYPRRKIQLPQRVVTWLTTQLGDAVGERGIPAGHPEPLIVPRADAFLVVRLVADHGRGQHLLILEEESLRAPPGSLQGLGLTEREAEVLAWVAQGKSNREIGMILGMSARTVQKHLEHVFEKLEVESRTAAILRAWQVGRYFSLGGR